MVVRMKKLYDLVSKPTAVRKLSCSDCMTATKAFRKSLGVILFIACLRPIAASIAHRLPASHRPSPRRNDLILRLGVEVARLVALAQLTRRIAMDAVHYPPALYRRSLGDRIGPALEVLVIGHLQELAGLVDQALGERAVPGPDRHVGDGVMRPAQVLALSQAPVEHVHLPLHLHGEAVDGVFDLARRI